MEISSLPKYPYRLPLLVIKCKMPMLLVVYNILNSTLGFSKRILLPKTLTWSKKSSGHDSLILKAFSYFFYWAKKCVCEGGG